jgi:hypothetical protein
MEFTLYYCGPLPATTTRNKRVREKQFLRRRFHIQLKELWNQKPLSDHSEFLQPKKETATKVIQDEDGRLFINFEDITLLRDVGDFQFVSTVSVALDMVADLTITLLRPEPPGGIVTQGGDIDNRLKTLLDALKVPREPAELPRGDTPSQDELPFFCLLEDDALITSLDVKTDRLLVPVADSSEVVLLLHVRTRIVQGNFANLGLV